MSRCRSPWIHVALALLTLGSSDSRRVFGQASSALDIPQVAFEVASVKRNTDVNAQRGARPPGPGGRFTAVVSVTDLVQVAFGVPNALFDAQVVGGPDWARQDLWEINAKIDGSVFAGPGGPPVRLLGMMRTLLAERFNLRLRQETRQLPVYELGTGAERRPLGSTPQACRRHVLADHRGQGPDHRLHPLLRLQAVLANRGVGERDDDGRPGRKRGFPG